MTVAQWRFPPRRGAGAGAAGRSGTSGMVWECGVVLAKYLESARPAALRVAIAEHKVVVELGAGTGVAGLAAAALGARVVLTDVRAALPLLDANARANAGAVEAAGGRVEAAELEWEAAADAAAEEEGVGSAEAEAAAVGSAVGSARLPAPPAQVGLLLAADVAYQREGRGLSALCSTVRRLAAGGGALLLAHKCRHPELDAALLQQMRDEGGMALEEVPRSHHHPDFRSLSIRLYIGSPAPPMAGVSGAAATPP